MCEGTVDSPLHTLSACVSRRRRASVCATSKRVHSPAKDTTSLVLSMEPSPGIRLRKPAHASTRRRAASKKRSLRAWKKRDPTASHGCTT